MAEHLAPHDSGARPVRAAQLSDYNKFLIHLAINIAAWVQAAASGGISALEAVQLAILLAGSAVVYLAENAATGPFAYAKAICAWIIAVGTAVLPYSMGGWSAVLAGMPTILAAAAGALGVGVVPNTGSASLSDAVRDILTRVQQVQSALPTQPSAAGSSYYVTTTGAGSSSGATQVRGDLAPATTAGARPAATETDTGTLERVRVRNGDSFKL